MNKNYKLYILLLTSIVIFTYSLKIYILNIDFINVTYSVLVYPFTYYLVSIIYHKSNYKYAFLGIVISIVGGILFQYMMDFALGEEFRFMSIIGEVCGYIISQFIGLSNYHFMKRNMKSTFLNVFLNYLLSLTFFYMNYILFHLDNWSIDYFKEEYIPIMGINIIMCIVITILNKKIKD